DQQEEYLTAAANALKTPAAELPERIVQILDERKKLEREVTDLRKQLALAGGGGQAQSPEAQQINGISFISRVLNDVPAKDLKPMADAFKGQLKSGVIALVSGFEGKVSVVVAVTEDLTSRVSAVDLVKLAAEAVGGKGGGGRPDMAQAGGADVAAMPKAVEAIATAIAQKAA
ncbi:MAG: alanine--tRNA ligase, partial [Alphaproteobacteria bacterium]|nr:alanine--tRNA ligase [Alphaproteobacteria bacterium]